MPKRSVDDSITTKALIPKEHIKYTKKEVKSSTALDLAHQVAALAGRVSELEQDYDAIVKSAVYDPGCKCWIIYETTLRKNEGKLPK